MLPLSVRRVASAAPQASSLLSSAAPAGLSVTARKGALHQRRYSSSKPSTKKRSKNATDEAVPNPPKPREAKEASEDAKSKNAARQDAINDLFRSLPSVPSTQNLGREAVNLASFFALHRPVSITHSLPRPVSDESFAEIFSNRPSNSAKTSPNDVISTISRAVGDIEGPMAKMSISRAEPDQPDDGVQKIEVRQANGRESTIELQVKDMMPQYLPFQPPPPPGPNSAAEESAHEASAEEDIEPQQRVYRAICTFEETVDSKGDTYVVAHSAQILGDGLDGSSVRYIDRLRRARYEDAMRRQGEGMHAISVKKRRKLKMKKKKFKKKLKASRKLRERLHKI